MKKILLLSDTHSYIDDQILKFVKQADEVWHAGDIGSIDVTDTIQKLKPLRAVYGNIDGKDMRAEFPLDSIFEIEDIFSINKGYCTFKVCSCKRLQSLKKLFFYGNPLTQ